MKTHHRVRTACAIGGVCRRARLVALSAFVILLSGGFRPTARAQQTLFNVPSAAGLARFKPLEELTDDDFAFTLANKLMGQVNLVRVGVRYISDGGSFTLTSGILSTEPVRGGAAISLVNAGLEGFARGAAVELPRGIRVNVVSPPWVSETLEEMGQDGSKGMPAARVAAAYVESVEGQRNGETLDARAFRTP